METRDVLFEQQDALAVITLNRPAQRNALSAACRGELDACLSKINAATRVVVIRGAGEDFCAGADLGDMPSDPMSWRARIQTAQSQHARIVNMKPVVISSVHGMAVGGGASLALAADIMVMSENARLSFPFVKLGVVPDGGASFLLLAKARCGASLDVLLTGGTITASEARELGLTRRVVAANALEAATMTLAQEISQLPPEGLQLTKSLCAQTWSPQMMASLRHEADAFALASVSEGHRDALAAARSRIAAKRPK